MEGFLNRRGTEIGNEREDVLTSELPAVREEENELPARKNCDHLLSHYSKSWVKWHFESEKLCVRYHIPTVVELKHGFRGSCTP